MSELKLNKGKGNLQSYIVVGDTIGDKTITEIWCTSTGKVMFTIGGITGWYGTFEEIINLIKIEEANKSKKEQQDEDYLEGVVAEEEYETMRQIAMDNGEL
jgi:hypothetical protein|tara:strand:+ start:922 stop:1224 length:303 start_codon:yes stop_codon:yes gene_type:complete